MAAHSLVFSPKLPPPPPLCRTPTDGGTLFTSVFPLHHAQSEVDTEVCGLVVSLRKGQHRIALWTKTCEESRVMPVGKKLKAALKVRDLTTPRVLIGGFFGIAADR